MAKVPNAVQTTDGRAIAYIERELQIWSPYYKKDIKLIAGVQRWATKLVAGMQDFKYNDRLKMLGLQRLEERRIRSDLIETFNIVNRKYDINPELFFQLDEGDRRGWPETVQEQI